MHIINKNILKGIKIINGKVYAFASVKKADYDSRIYGMKKKENNIKVCSNICIYN